ncbi:uncharacterized protein LOC144048585 [Vanacampus margaritifer]
MLKELVRERLIAAADEIFGIFEKTIASYEEQLRRAREETERHRRQLEHVCNAQIVIRVKDIQQQWGSSSSGPEHPQPLDFNREEENPQPIYIQEDAKDLQPPHIKEEDIIEFPLTGISGDDEDEPPKWLQLHHGPSGDQRGGPPSDNLLTPLFDSGNVEESLRSDAYGEGDNKRSETTLGNKETSQTPEQRFACSFCNKSFSANSILNIHLRTHTGEKPFACPVCGKRFAQKPSIATHMKTHTGERPFSCLVCHKTFSRRYHLEIHMRTHTGEKPYNCSVCGVNFRHRSSLKVHMRVHNAEKMKKVSQ